jgi:transposase
MKLIARKVFQKAKQVTDRFHVQKLALEALQEIRIKLRWEVLDKEMKLQLKPSSIKLNLLSKTFLTVIQPNNYSKEVVFCFTKVNTNGVKVKR